MIRVEAIQNFNYSDFRNIKELERADFNTKNESIKIYVGDSFLVTKKQYNYLIKDNLAKEKLVRIIEYVPEAQQ